MSKKLIDLNDMDNEKKPEEEMNTDTREEVETPQINSESPTEPSSDISSIMNKIATKKQQKPVKTQVSIYLDDEVYKKYIRFGRKYGKGARSSLVNDLLKVALKDY